MQIAFELVKSFCRNIMYVIDVGKAFMSRHTWCKAGSDSSQLGNSQDHVTCTTKFCCQTQVPMCTTINHHYPLHSYLYNRLLLQVLQVAISLQQKHDPLAQRAVRKCRTSKVAEVGIMSFSCISVEYLTHPKGLASDIQCPFVSSMSIHNEQNDM